MKRGHWKSLIASLPPGLTQTGAANFLKQPAKLVRDWIIKAKYDFKDGRKGPWSEARRRNSQKLDWRRVDWSKRDCEIARWIQQHKNINISRERVRQVRKSQA